MFLSFVLQIKYWKKKQQHKTTSLNNIENQPITCINNNYIDVEVAWPSR